MTHSIEGFSFAKFIELRIAIKSFGVDIIILTGSLSNAESEHFISSYDIPGYRLFTNDLLAVSIGVCIIYVSNQIRCKKITEGVFTQYQKSLWIIIDDAVLLAAIYRDMLSPSLTEDKILQRVLNESDQIVGLSPYLLVDFTSTCDTVFSHLFSNLESVRILKHRTTDPMHGIYLFSKQRLNAGHFHLLCGFGLNTRGVVTFWIDHQPYRSQLFKEFKCYEKADYEKMAQYLDIDWMNTLRGVSASKGIGELEGYIKNAENKCVPREKSLSEILPKWMERKYKKFVRLIKEKQFGWNKKEGFNSDAKCIWIKIENGFYKERRVYEKSLKLKDSADWISEYMHMKNENIDYIIDIHGDIIEGDYNIAEAFSQYFQSVYNEEDIVVDYTTINSNTCSDQLIITEKLVKDELGKLKVNKAVGPDSIHSAILKNLADILAPALTIIFNRSLSRNEIPYNWKLSRIFPKYKGDDRFMICNYRPISITSPVIKVLERIINNHITDYLINKNLLTPFQHGYKNYKSRHTNLIESLNAWTVSLENRRPVDVIYLDLSHAYDTVPHHRLLLVLLEYGVNQQLLNWIATFLIGRESYVRINHQVSNTERIKSGVPQGSVLANLLFAIFMNKIPTVVNCEIQMYSDDIKIYSVLKRTDNGAFVSTLQNELTHLDEHMRKMQMNFNFKKCKVLHFGGDNPNIVYKIKDSKGAEVHLASVRTQRDLGVYVDSQLNFSDHVHIVIDKARTHLLQMSISFSIITKDIFFAYYDIIRGILESASVIWSPLDKELCDILESVQRDATSMIDGLSTNTYTHRLKILQLPTLQHRRKRNDLIQIYRFKSGLSKLEHTIPSNALHHDTCRAIAFEYASSIERTHFLYNRVAHRWNMLSNETVNSETIEQFITLLDEELNEDFIYEYEFNYDCLTNYCT